MKKIALTITLALALCFLGALNQAHAATTDTITVIVSMAEIISVEHDRQWYYEMLTKLGGAGASMCTRVRPYHVVDKDAYVAFIEHYKDTTDFVFIDGMWRVECARAVLKYCKKGTVVVFHDLPHKDFRDSIRGFSEYYARDDTGVLIV